MAKNTTFTITGLNEIKRAYRELPRTVANKVVRQAVRKAVKPIAAKVKELTPKATGRLAKATKVRARKKKKRGTIAIDVIQEQAGSSFKDAVFHGGFVNYGTAKITGRHYFEAAFEQTKERAAADVASEIAGGIIREARRLAGGSAGGSSGGSGGGSGASDGGSSGSSSPRARDSKGRFLKS